jgi:alkaline phosphatase D
VCPRPGRGGSNVVPAAACPGLFDPALTLLGKAQEEWLRESLAASRARWNVIEQQTLMAQVDRTPGEGQSFWNDGWDGYPAARARLLRSVSESGAANPLVIGGDIHTFVVADLKSDFKDPAAPVVATEFGGGSITSQGPGLKQTQAWMDENPHILFANGMRRGYGVLELAPKRCVARFRTVADVTDPNTSVRTLASWTVEHGRPGVQRGA